VGANARASSASAPFSSPSRGPRGNAIVAFSLSLSLSLSLSVIGTISPDRLSPSALVESRPEKAFIF